MAKLVLLKQLWNQEMELVLLADKPEAIPQLAKWYNDEWGTATLNKEADDSSRSTQALEDKLKDKQVGWKAVEQLTYHGVKVLVMKLKVNEQVCEEQKRA
ncbi:hypothetical protein [Shewanella benthica]|nr:hypothetical protein [Shewanella benthica]